MKRNLLFSTLLIIPIAAGCDDRDSPSQVQAPGDPKTAKSQVLEHGAQALQTMPPIGQINMYLNGFHFYADDMGRQVEAHHYCTHLNEDLHQCVIFDGNGEGAKLIGIEYIVSEKLFKQLPDGEKKLWHSHHHEVKSGTLVMPNLPDGVEKEAMEKLVSTYGKTFHTWQVDRGDTLPLGIPQLMMGFTSDGQLKPELLQQRDQRLKVSTGDKRKVREPIPLPNLVPGANAWESGQSSQLQLKQLDIKNAKPSK
jgi:hypothetical protein